MSRDDTRHIPKAGWWNVPTMTIEDFGYEIDRLQAIPFTRDDVTFSHDVFADDFFVGEAAMVEEVGPGLRIGFLSIGSLKTAPPVYGVINSDFTLRPKGLSLQN